MGKRLRRIGDPVIASSPAGVRVRTRLHLSAGEAAALAAVGEYLVRCIAANWRAGFGWAAWIARRIRGGGRSGNRR